MLTFDDGYYDVYKNAFPIMRELHFTGILGIILAKVDESDYLYGRDIRALQTAGWEIASHTWDHVTLTSTPIKQLAHEIMSSRKDLQKWFSARVKIFVYPGGYY